MGTSLSVNQTVAKNIRFRRIEKAATQADLAERLTQYSGRRWTVSKVSDVERASEPASNSARSKRERQVTVDELVWFAAALEVSVFDLLLPAEDDQMFLGTAVGAVSRHWASLSLFHIPGSTLREDSVNRVESEWLDWRRTKFMAEIDGWNRGASTEAWQAASPRFDKEPDAPHWRDIITEPDDVNRMKKYMGGVEAVDAWWAGIRADIEEVNAIRRQIPSELTGPLLTFEEAAARVQDFEEATARLQDPDDSGLEN